MWLLGWAAMALSMLLSYRISRKFLGAFHSVLVALLVSSGMAAGYWDGDTPDNYAAVCDLAALLFLADAYVEDDLRPRAAAAIGCLTSLAFWMKPNMIASILVICACHIFRFAASKRFGLVGACFASFGLGFILTSLPVIIFLASRGALSEMVNDYFIFNSSYTSFYNSINEILVSFSFYVSHPSIMLTLLCILFGLLLELQPREIHANRNWMMLDATASFAMALFLMVYPGNQYDQYCMLLVPSMALAYISTVKGMTALGIMHHKTIGIALTLITLCIITLNGMKEYRYCQFFWGEVPQEMEERDFIMANTAEEDTIAVVSPYYCGFYLATGRLSATRFPYVQEHHFSEAVEGSPAAHTFAEEYLDSITSAKPRMILVDRDYQDTEFVSEMLSRCSNWYRDSGKSARFLFLTLRERLGNSVPVFQSNAIVPNNSVSFTVPDDMIEKYRNGDISFDDIMTLFDEAIEQ